MIKALALVLSAVGTGLAFGAVLAVHRLGRQYRRLLADHLALVQRYDALTATQRRHDAIAADRQRLH